MFGLVCLVGRKLGGFLVLCVDIYIFFFGGGPFGYIVFVCFGCFVERF